MRISIFRLRFRRSWAVYRPTIKRILSQLHMFVLITWWGRLLRSMACFRNRLVSLGPYKSRQQPVHRNTVRCAFSPSSRRLVHIQRTGFEPFYDLLQSPPGLQGTSMTPSRSTSLTYSALSVQANVCFPLPAPCSLLLRPHLVVSITFPLPSFMQGGRYRIS